MLKLDRIMEIAEDTARRVRDAGSLGAEIHNIQAISVAIQEALSENDDNAKETVRSNNGSSTPPTDGKPRGISRGRKTRETVE